VSLHPKAEGAAKVEMDEVKTDEVQVLQHRITVTATLVATAVVVMEMPVEEEEEEDKQEGEEEEVPRRYLSARPRV